MSQVEFQLFSSATGRIANFSTVIVYIHSFFIPTNMTFILDDFNTGIRHAQSLFLSAGSSKAGFSSLLPKPLGNIFLVFLREMPGF
ncbi:MAG: hypothetical protein ABI760_06400 [Ferruginibacter sp.]